MLTITSLSKALQEILTTTANDLARATRFTQRQSKITGAAFTQALVLGWLANGDATLEELTQGLAAVDIPLSPQGLAYRFNQQSAELLKHVLQRATQQLLAVDPVAIPLLKRFKGVYLQDSSTITLPQELALEWQGCGGNPGQGEAAVKMQVQFDLCRGTISHLALQNGRTPDQVALVQTLPIPTGALRLADLGYFNIGVFETLGKQGGYWLSRYQVQVKIRDESQQVLEIPRWLATQTTARIDRPILLGDRHHLPCRLIAVRVPLTIAAERRRRLHQEAREKGLTVSQLRLQLTDWTIFLTNVPVEKLSVDEALVMARCRWQIELLFNLWKTYGKVGVSRSAKPWRILCELYAKLLAMLIQHWLLLISCWHYPNRSLYKASKTIQRYAWQLLISLARGANLVATIKLIQKCLAIGCRINKRKATPHAFQLLLAFSE